MKKKIIRNYSRSKVNLMSNHKDKGKKTKGLLAGFIDQKQRNKIINQKYFYSDDDNDEDINEEKDKQKTILIRTKNKIEINKREKEKLISYLEEKK